jgi:glutamate-1-semialdehyde 2,1-aminomutase
MRTNEPSTHDLIPGGAHTYSKGDDQFPANAPKHLERGEGAFVWSDTGDKFLDWTMGLRTMTLGYGSRAVIDAAIEQIEKGSNFGRPSAIEKEAAQDLIDLIPSAEMVKFAKNGSTVTSAAVKLARAYTGRSKVAICKDHPFFSYDDWFIGTTPSDGGIPETERHLSLVFQYNNAASLERLFIENADEIACVIMEAVTFQEPENDFLQNVQTLCRKNGAVFIIDEMITGFRWHLNGAQAMYGLEPDLSTFGKGIANGFSVSALVGRREIMELGGLQHDKKRVFLISTTHGAENHGLAALQAALTIYQQEDVIGHLWRVGGELIKGLNQVALEAGIGGKFRAFGFPCSPYFNCLDQNGEVSLPLRTLFLQEMVKNGVLMNYISPSFSHGPEEIEQTIEAAQKSLMIYGRALEDGVENFLEGPSIKPVFRPYN